MNVFLTLAGIAAIAGTVAHAVFGHRWTIGAVDPAGLTPSRFAPETNRRFLIWFWHVGTLVMGATGAVFLAAGLGLFAAERQLLWFGALIWIGITAVFFLVAGRPPAQIRAMPPGPAGLVINALILLGLLT